MSKQGNLIYSGAFIVLLLALSIGSVRGVQSFSAASETTVLDGKLSHSFEKHYDKQFPVKEFGTNAWAAVEFGLFGEGRPGVVVGREDWLFTDEEFKPALKPEQLDENWALVKGIQAEFKRRNMELVLALLPAKARLYPEYFADTEPVSAHRQLYADALERMQKNGFSGPDLLRTLQAAKSQDAVFLRTDTHWTPYGAETVAQNLADYVRQRGLWQNGGERFVTEVGEAELHKGDLLSFLPLDPYFVGLQPPGETLLPRTTLKAEEGQSQDALFGDEKPSIALVGTSYSANSKWNFAGALKQALGSDLLNYAENGHGPLVPMLHMLQRDAAEVAEVKLVIWEIPERYLMMPSDLSSFDPAWLANLRGEENDKARLAVNDTGTATRTH
ncbi:alginate O-acetyltransferase [Pseudomonas sp. LRF_L74]|uniref:alginate O-acetyltransferase n=1 Tax=Pseudomonas sp. LRF_L74 TaxID=3369422 RepID=UPI003F5DA2C7